jgi:transposase
MTKVTVLPVSDRRRWTAPQKLEIVQESYGVGATVSEVARRHGVRAGLVYQWREKVRTGVISGGRESEAQFMPVALAESLGQSMSTNAPVADMIELVLRNGRILRVPDRVAPVRVLQLAELLEGNIR